MLPKEHGLTLWDGAGKHPDKTYFSKTSPFGTTHTAVFNIDPDAFTIAYDRWSKHSVLIQDAFPNLNDDEREFILTGCTPDEWDRLTKGL